MPPKYKDFETLLYSAGRYLADKLFYTEKTIYNYYRMWRQIETYMNSKSISAYDEKVGIGFIKERFRNYKIGELTRKEKELYNAIKILTEFYLIDKITLPSPPKKQPLVFEGAIGGTIKDFLFYKKNIERLSKTRLNCYKRALFLFLKYCNKANADSINAVDLPLILEYIKSQDAKSTSTVMVTLSTLRGFLSYAFDQELIAVDLAKKIPKHKVITQPKLPSTYSQEEINKLIQSVDRTSAVGKRNYAIIILASKLGLRASDISKLRFDNINWNESTIHLTQVKTGKDIILPLLADVGNAIIDYLKFGRPKSEEPYIFLTERPPRGPFSSSNVVTHVVQRAFLKAGISIKSKRFGPHALRHSLGSQLLKINTSLPVITEVLGHQSTESTRFYLRIDLNSMKHCMLNVPIVPIDFYQQKNEAFYE